MAGIGDKSPIRAKTINPPGIAAVQTLKGALIRVTATRVAPMAPNQINHSIILS
jgi:hypothetical protein